MSLAPTVVPLLTSAGVVAESTPAPVSTTVPAKKSKSGSSAEEEEVFVLHVSPFVPTLRVTSLSRLSHTSLSTPLMECVVQVRGRERYEFLKRINDGQELLDREK